MRVRYDVARRSNTIFRIPTKLAPGYRATTTQLWPTLFSTAYEWNVRQLDMQRIQDLGRRHNLLRLVSPPSEPNTEVLAKSFCILGCTWGCTTVKSRRAMRPNCPDFTRQGVGPLDQIHPTWIRQSIYRQAIGWAQYGVQQHNLCSCPGLNEYSLTKSVCPALVEVSGQLGWCLGASYLRHAPLESYPRRVVSVFSRRGERKEL